MGFGALIGISLGMHFSHAQSVSNLVNNDIRDRVDSSVLCNLA